MNSREVVVWLDERWYDALSRQLKKKDTTVENELNEYLDAMIDQLPKDECFTKFYSWPGTYVLGHYRLITQFYRTATTS